MSEMLPPWIPARLPFIWATGLFELALAAGLARPATARTAGIATIVVSRSRLPRQRLRRDATRPFRRPRPRTRVPRAARAPAALPDRLGVLLRGLRPLTLTLSPEDGGEGNIEEPPLPVRGEGWGEGLLPVTGEGRGEGPSLAYHPASTVTSPTPRAPYMSLRHRDYRRLLFSQLFSLIGSQMQVVAINWHIYLLTRSPLALGFVGLTRVVPIVLFSLWAGVVADRRDRRRVMIAAQIAMTCVALAARGLHLHAPRDALAALWPESPRLDGGRLRRPGAPGADPAPRARRTTCRARSRSTSRSSRRR